MPRWFPEKKWEGEEVFIIGGGDSLKTFDWNLLKPHLTIGCNDAYQYGKDICKLCIFGDAGWLEAHRHSLAAYKGVVFTNSGKVAKYGIPWIWTLQRETKGLHHNAIGWNANTGAAAINLALLLGAVKINLLGFDMQLSKKGNNNWHPNTVNKPDPEVFPKFLKGFKYVADDLKKKFPGVEIINVTDDSRLDLFPKIGVNEFWRLK